jgi:hypothetical protein
MRRMPEGDYTDRLPGELGALEKAECRGHGAEVRSRNNPEINSG